MNRRNGERLSAVLWAVIGVAILVASWRMDRLEDRGINPWSAPGLTPGVVGALILVLALVLAWPSRPAAGRGGDELSATADGSAGEQEAVAAPERTDVERGSWGRTLLALALCFGFAALALGHGLPFVIEGAVFIFVFTTVFSLPLWREQARVVRGLAQTAAVAVVTSLFVSWLFESVFLVRLP